MESSKAEGEVRIKMNAGRDTEEVYDTNAKGHTNK